MKKVKYIVPIFILLIATSLSSAAQTSTPDALSWYGYENITLNEQYSSGVGFEGKDDQIFRKRRHKRRRKISPEKKGW